MSGKKIAVRYYSKSGNTKKLAERIAAVAGCNAETTDVDLREKVDILFLGAAVYWAGIDKSVKEYIERLDKSMVGKVVIFSTSALAERAVPSIKKHLTAKKIKVVAEDFYCHGQFASLHRGKPDEKDLVAVEEFTRKIIG
ncbi:MAG: flavodoxin [Herbinix sp.]|jgi:flavodoxin|nr:flavodoxin [Herbinix sp.]